jgi:death-on-curing protein
MERTPKWIRQDVVLTFHDQQIAEHGGLSGLLDAGKLESALTRPQNKWNDSDSSPDMADLAAAYACGICQAHAFADGNKRTGAVTAITFLLLNGCAFDPPEQELVEIMIGIASGTIDEHGAARWFRSHMGTTSSQ